MTAVPITFIDDPIIKFDHQNAVTDDGRLYRKDLAPGGAHWNRHENGVSLSYVCPCGCGAAGQLPLYTGETKPKGSGWQWNGDFASPTLQPSIQITAACRWHGYLTNGEWVKL